MYYKNQWQDKSTCGNGSELGYPEEGFLCNKEQALRDNLTGQRGKGKTKKELEQNDSGGS
jgi:hypothetical protein